MSNEEQVPGDGEMVLCAYSTGMDRDHNLLAPGTPDSALRITHHPAWLAEDGESGWIGAIEPGTVSSPPGDDVYMTTFDLSGY